MAETATEATRLRMTSMTSRKSSEVIGNHAAMTSPPGDYREPGEVMGRQTRAGLDPERRIGMNTDTPGHQTPTPMQIVGRLRTLAAPLDQTGRLIRWQDALAKAARTTRNGGMWRRQGPVAFAY